MKRIVALCVLLVWTAGLGAGCAFFERQTSEAARETQPAREQVSKDAQQLIEQLQQKVNDLEAQVKELQQKAGGEQGSQ